jgi:SNF2 family DNA or RNA helicase
MLSRHKRVFALLMEMGTGKSKIIVDTAAYQYNRGGINALVVVAPNGVHRNWIDIEVPVHLPDYIERTTGYWVATPRKAQRLALERLFTDDLHKLRVIAINIDALSTKRGKAFVRKLMNMFKVLMCVDESDDIKTAGSSRTMSAIALGKHAVMRRICTGTSITQGPLDLYSQYKFLSPQILGYTTKASFQSHFAEYERIELRAGSMNKSNNQKAGRDFYDKLICYRNLPELTELIRPHSYRKLKKDCLDLPDKIYAPPYPVELSKDQRRLYNDAVTETVVYLRNRHAATMPLFDEIDNDEDLIDAIVSLDTKTQIKNALTKLLRAQQIIGGYFTDEDGKVHAIDKKNKRVAALMSIVAGTQSPVIIWARFKAEIRAISAALRECYGERSVVEYYGDVSAEDREDAKVRFQGERHHVDIRNGEHTVEIIPEHERARFFVGNAAAGGRGITLTRAQYVIYYSNSFSLSHRLQSEDRAHRIGQTNNVTYVDLQATNTFDSHIKKALLDKEKLSDKVLDGLN